MFSHPIATHREFLVAFTTNLDWKTSRSDVTVVKGTRRQAFEVGGQQLLDRLDPSYCQVRSW